MTPMLLISVQNFAELRMCHDLGVRWIDLKDPNAGSLGCPDPACIAEVLQDSITLGLRPASLSLALGELRELAIHEYRPMIQPFDFLKVGTSGIRDDEIARLATAAIQGLDTPSRLILAHYADHHLANSPEFDPILECAIGLKCRYLLIDTYSKRSGKLLDWYSLEQLAKIVERVHAVGMRISLAGSLRLQDLPRIAEIGPDVIAVRGAACHAGQRWNELCRDRISSLLALIKRNVVSVRNAEHTNNMCSPNE